MVGGGEAPFSLAVRARAVLADSTAVTACGGEAEAAVDAPPGSAERMLVPIIELGRWTSDLCLRFAGETEDGC